MKLLFIGGTKFLGRHAVEAALARGHQVTLFNRGQQNPGLFPEAEHLVGDRDGGLDVLGGGEWDAVVDTCGYVPRVVRASARLLAERVGLYVFVSSISVYADHTNPRDENAPLGTLTEETEEVTGDSYGPLKALCERAAEEETGGRALVVRSGLIVGPHDPTMRFSYWTRRVAQGGEVLAPGDPERLVQFIDARDLGEWMIRMAEEGRAGVFNASGRPLSFGRFLEECRAASESDARFTWVDDEFLLAQGVEPWSHLPLWLPYSDEQFRYFQEAICERAFAAGLSFRPLAETIRDTLAWQRAQPDGGGATPRAGVPVPDHSISRERESELLRLWHERNN
jgi:2'-hydroxyisoflavone reductase